MLGTLDEIGTCMMRQYIVIEGPLGVGKSISFKYLESINLAFNEFFFHYTDCPMLVVDASEIDFVHVLGDFENLVEQIKRMKSGIQYYVPISSKTS